jgi:peptide-methionine (S)-S-oxide reductase
MLRWRVSLLLLTVVLCAWPSLAANAGDAAAPGAAKSAAPMPPPKPEPAAPKALVRATFAGGCFWCMEAAFEGALGVVSATSGYAGGHTENPTYEEVSSGTTGHAESVQVVFDPKKITYEKLLDIYWHNIDPTTPYGQFCDMGSQYRPIIFTVDDAQRRLAEASKRRLDAAKTFSGPIATEIVPLKAFYPAEEHHQNFCSKNPVNYKAYRLGCGRDQRLEELWGKAPEH